MRKYFSRRVVRYGRRFQIWERKAGGKWLLVIERNQFADQYGPYAR